MGESTGGVGPAWLRGPIPTAVAAGGTLLSTGLGLLQTAQPALPQVHLDCDLPSIVQVQQGNLDWFDPSVVPCRLEPAPTAQSLTARVRIVNYNLAGGAEGYRNSWSAFRELEVMKPILEGKRDAPILAMQEVSPANVEAMRADAAKTGAFTVHTQRQGDGLRVVLLVPTRFEVLETRGGLYGGQDEARARTRRIEQRTGYVDSNAGDVRKPRGYVAVVARDELTGQKLIVFNTHGSLSQQYQLVSTRQAMDIMRQLQAKHPEAVSIYAGDLNAEYDHGPKQNDEQILGVVQQEGFREVDRHNLKDHIFIKPPAEADVPIAAAQVIPTGQGLSDHKPVEVVVSLPRTNLTADEQRALAHQQTEVHEQLARQASRSTVRPGDEAPVVVWKAGEATPTQMQ